MQVPGIPRARNINRIQGGTYNNIYSFRRDKFSLFLESIRICNPRSPAP